MIESRNEETRALVECATAVGSVRIFQMRFTTGRLIITQIAQKHWAWNLLGPFSAIGNGRFREETAERRGEVAALSVSELLSQYPDSEVFTRDQVKSISPDLQIVFTDGKKRRYMLCNLVEDPVLTQDKPGIADVVECFLGNNT